MQIVLALDPSGAFHEGKGCTGWCLMNKESKELLDIGTVSAEDYPTDMQYFAANIDLLYFCKNRYGTDLQIVMEDYVLYAAQAQAQTNSHMETCQLIGAIKYQAFLLDIPVKMQLANMVTTRWADTVLVAKGILVDGRFPNVDFAPNPHERDAFRHALHYATFNGKDIEEGGTYGIPTADPRALRGGTRSRSGFIPRGFCFAEEEGVGGQ